MRESGPQPAAAQHKRALHWALQAVAAEVTQFLAAPRHRPSTRRSALTSALLVRPVMKDAKRQTPPAYTAAHCLPRAIERTNQVVVGYTT